MSLPPKVERTIKVKFSKEEQDEFKEIEKKAQDFYLNFRAMHTKDLTSHFLTVSQQLLPMRVASSGGKYPIETKIDEDGNKDENDTNMEDNDAKKKSAVKEYSKFAFTSKFRVLLSELESIRDSDSSCACEAVVDSV